MRTLRRQVALQMVRAHGITRALAILHVSKMDARELQFRWEWYTRVVERKHCSRCDHDVEILADGRQFSVCWKGCIRLYHQHLCDTAGMELSVMERNQQSRPDFYQVFGSTTATARPLTLNPVPELPIEPRNGQETARAGSKKPGPMVDRALSASH
jgi:hypothetical protein